MKTAIYLDNYRGFSNEWIPLEDVNFLVGENSTGKTSFIDVLEIFYNPAFWLLEPRFGVPGTTPKHFKDLVSASSESKKEFTIGGVFENRSSACDCYGMLVTYTNIDGRPMPKRVSVIDSGDIRTVDGKLWVASKGEKYKYKLFKCNKSEYSCQQSGNIQVFIEAHSSNKGFSIRKVSDELHGAPLFVRCEDALFSKTNEEREFKAPYMFQRNIVQLAPIRSKPKRTYDTPQIGFSREGEHTPYIIKKRLSNKSQADVFYKFLSKIGLDSGLFESITVKNYGKDQTAPFEIKIVLGKSALGLDNVGYGVSQALPILVELFVQPQGTMFTIQQPEVHLHPKAQASIGDLIAEMARNDKKRFVIETHSDFTIDRYRLNIKKNGNIDSQLLFFERINAGNKVTTIKINNDGCLSENQPDAYREFFFNESLALLG